MISGGGTGGHAYAGVAIARKLLDKYPSSDVLFIGSVSGPEKQIALDSDVEYEGLEIQGFAGRKLAERIRSLWLLARGTARCVRIMKSYDPGCVIGTGGYAAAPACLAAVLKKKKLVLHEMNSNPGMVTRYLGRHAYAIATAYEETKEALGKKARVVTTGVPVRREIEELGGEKARSLLVAGALGLFGLEEGRKTLLVFGGSQGSTALNQATWKAIGQMSDRRDLQLLHFTGKKGCASGKSFQKQLIIEGRELLYRVFEYSERMDLAYAVADLALTRAGAGTIAELAAARVPAILVPYPYASSGHQQNNAEIYASIGAARVVSQEGDSADSAMDEAARIITSEETLLVMREAARESKLGRGAEGMVRIVEEMRL